MARTRRGSRTSRRSRPTARTITLTLTEPDSTLLWNLTGRAGLILKEGDTVDYKTAANGTGPFVLDDWRQGDSITFVRNDAYWGDKAQVAEVVFDYIPDNQAALNAALAGEVDVLTGFDANLQGADRGERRLHARARQVHRQGHARVQPDRRARSPTSACARRSGRRSTTTRSSRRSASGQTQYGPIPELDPGYEDLSDVAPFDPEARQGAAGRGGRGGPLADADDPELLLARPIPQILVSNLNEVGITLEVDSVDFSTWLNDVYINKDYDL